MVEAAAEATEELMEKYLEDRASSQSEDEIKQGAFAFARWPTRSYPVMERSVLSRTRAYRRYSMAVIEYMPSPTEVKAIEGTLARQGRNR